jgi:hypothetical protein
MARIRIRLLAFAGFSSPTTVQGEVPAPCGKTRPQSDFIETTVQPSSAASRVLVQFAEVAVAVLRALRLPVVVVKDQPVAAPGGG